MSNIRKTEEELKQIKFEFLTDRNIATWNNTIAAIYNTSIPQMLIKDGEEFTIKYSDKVEYEIDRIRKIMTNYIEERYSDILNHETNKTK